MNLKSPKMWAAIIGIGLALVGAVTGMDLKKAMCEGEVSTSESK